MLSSLAGKIGSNVPIVGSYYRSKQEQEQLSRQQLLQQAIELELSKQNIASAVTILSGAFLESSPSSSSSRGHGRRRSQSSSLSSSGTVTPTTATTALPDTSASSDGQHKALRSVRSNPLLRLIGSSSSPTTSAAPSATSSKRNSLTVSPSPELVSTNNYTFAPTLPSTSSSTAGPASLSNSLLAEQYIQSVHFLLSALSPTQAAQLPDISRRQMRMSLSQAIDRLDLADATSPSAQQDRASFWSARSQISALDRLLRSGEPSRASTSLATSGSVAFPSSASPSAPGPQAGYPFDHAAYPRSQHMHTADRSSGSTRGKVVEIATMPAHVAFSVASQAASAMVLCTQLVLGIAIPMIWLMSRMSPINAFRSKDKSKIRHQEESVGLFGSAAHQVMDFSHSPLGLYANAMFAKHAPNAHARAAAVWTFAEEHIANSSVTAQTPWPVDPRTCPHTGAINVPNTVRSTSSSTSSQRTLVESPWAAQQAHRGHGPTSPVSSGIAESEDGKFLTWPRQPISPRLRTISAPDQQQQQPPAPQAVAFPTAAGAAAVQPDSTVEAPPNKRRWSSLISRGTSISFSQLASPLVASVPTRPPLPHSMSMQRHPHVANNATLHPHRASSISTASPTRPSPVATHKHVRQHSWAPEMMSASSSSTAMAVSQSAATHRSSSLTPAPSSAMTTYAVPAQHSQDPPTLPDVLTSLSVQTSRALSDPANSYSVYNLVPGASLRRSLRKNASRSMRQAIFWARTNGVLRAGVDAVCVGLEAALAGVEAWGDSEYERQQEEGAAMALMLEGSSGSGSGSAAVGGVGTRRLRARVCPCPCGQIHYDEVEDDLDLPTTAPPMQGLGITLN
ncbi:hypothetical protein OC846_004047 [Tilletia horrida]|uniref:Uncharacterized protein n=1 Tax=Tilletia horrida TaxID=155126 RepID=A0AAN6GP10_9BASI|nr:hypothetical protein OC846_004047 [Tilletia horrida]KAK0564268.1 hypothetical protein OC861_004370 [Tilletia horrida]